MNETKTATHTPGPWEAVSTEPEHWNIRSIEHGGIASIHCPIARDIGCEPILEANAQLIAAAPDLLHALESIVKRIDNASGAGIMEADEWFEMQSLIAKAKGETKP